MANERLRTQITEWLATQPYWLQYAGQQILQNEELTDEVVDDVYTYLKQDAGLEPVPANRPGITFPTAAANTGDEGPLVLEAIKNALNVNALASEQTIPLGPQLNLIYGGNGVGKSGYIRVLNNAFSSRGDKTILPDVFSDGEAGPPSCEFTFRRTEEPYDLKYEDDIANPEFTQFCVFDSVSVRAHLDGENTLAFTPAGFEFFELLLEIQGKVKQKLAEEIARRQPRNTFLEIFPSGNEVGEFVADMNSDTDFGQLDALAGLSQVEQTEIEQIDVKVGELRQINRVERLQQLQTLSNQLDALQQNLEIHLDNASAEKLEEFRAAIRDVASFEQLAQSEGIRMFEGFEISNVGSPEWRAFIAAGRNYVTKVRDIVEVGEYPQLGSHCIFCLQPLDGDSLTLVSNYWTFLKSTAEVELANAKSRRERLLNSTNNSPKVVFDETTQVHQFMKDLGLSVDDCKTVIDRTSAVNAALCRALTEMDADLLPDVPVSDLATFQLARDAINKEREQLLQLDLDSEITQLLQRKRLLDDKVRLEQVKDQISTFLSEAKWVRAANTVHQGIVTNSITIVQGRLYKEHVTDEYLAKFNQECEALNAPPFIHIAQRNERATTLRKLKVRDASAMKVLSEGEQRAIGLADFITEARLNPINRGVVFDDPVSSQDHVRRSRIAQRIAELAKIRQVIVFTHDIAFFLELQRLAESAGLQMQSTTIRRVGSTPGIVISQLPWIAQSVKKRVGSLKQELVELKKIEQGGDEDAYIKALKTWYERLRETWERSVEERLFKGVIERFAPSVQTQRLKQVAITPELLSQIEKGMTESSKWIHDAAANLNPTTPDTSIAEQHLTDLETFLEACPAP